MKPYTRNSSQFIQLLLRNLDCDGIQLHAPSPPSAAHELRVKGTSQDKATSNSAKIKPIALAVIELRLSEGISKRVSHQSVESYM